MHDRSPGRVSPAATWVPASRHRHRGNRAAASSAARNIDTWLRARAVGLHPESHELASFDKLNTWY